MIEPFLEEGAWCYWVVSVGALLSFLGLVVACICSCRRNETKTEFLGLAGMVTLNDSDNDGFNGIPLTDAVRVTTQDPVDSGKRSTSANRSLPDIPNDKEKRRETANASAVRDIYETTETIGDHSELYATVRDTAATVEEETRELDAAEVAHQNASAQETLDDPYSRFASFPNSDNVEHPYAQLHSVQKAEASQSNRKSSAKQPIDAEKPGTCAAAAASASLSASTSACTCPAQMNGNPVAPPRTRRSSSHNSLLSGETGLVADIQAANAISGGVQANQDLPYMTPPLLMLLPQPPESQSNSPQQNFSGDSQDSKGYTSISVREPLANIIAQTKTIGRQSQPVRAFTDPHYATVSDDSDEMYAAIDEQDKVYTSGSETYAQIQPTMTEVQRVQNEQSLFSRAPSRSDETYSAPQPPSVDSLRHVAHAHSRQASSSSANSSIVNPGSPKPEKRQANSPLPPPPEATAEMYACIDKRTKNEERSKSALSNGKSLEDMYAKVMKKKKDAEEQQSDLHPHTTNSHSHSHYHSHSHSHSHSHPHSHSHSHGSAPCEMLGLASARKPSLVEVNRISWSSHDSAELQKKEFDSVVGGSVRLDADADAEADADADLETNAKSSLPPCKGSDEAPVANFLLDHGYEAVNSSESSKKASTIRDCCDPNYEVLRPQQHVAPDGIPMADYQQAGTADLPIVSSSSTSSCSASSYSVPFKHRQISNASSEDPGYEKVRLRRRCEIDQDTDSEPNYESMPHDSGEPNYASVCRPGDSDTDPNYESVNHGDPNYESVKYMSVARAEDPPYEQVNAYKLQQDPNRYEKLAKQISFDADYERIQRQRDRPAGSLNGDDGETDDEQYVQV